ncbi:hypothetical protein STANM309S_01472 [Streptomyces tanashiensis]
MTPPGDNGDMTELWLGLLAESGADAGLTDAGLPARGAVLRRGRGLAGALPRRPAPRSGPRPTPSALLELVERQPADCAPIWRSGPRAGGSCGSVSRT